MPLGRSVFDKDVLALDITEVTEPLAEGLWEVRISCQVGRQVAYSSDLGRLLRLGRQRAEKATDGGQGDA